MKKVVFFFPGLYPCATGGMEIFNFYLAKEMCHIVPISVITYCKKIDLDKDTIHRITTRMFGVRIFGLGNLSILISALYVILRLRTQIALIHVPCTSRTGFYGLLFPLLKKIWHIKYIIVFHGGGMRPWRLISFNRMLFRNADRIIGVSESIQQEYERRTGRSVKLILPLIPLKKSSQKKSDLRLKFGFSKVDKIFLMLGSIKPLKGNMLVYEVFKHFFSNKIRDYPVKLLFVGDGEDRSQLEYEIVKDGMTDHVKVIPAVPYEKVKEFFKMVDFYIIASLFEGTPKSLLEAMFNGLPVIGRNTTGINSILINEKNALLFSDASDLEIAMERIISQPQLAAKLGESARFFFAEKYDFYKTLHAFEGLYNSYISE